MNALENYLVKSFHSLIFQGSSGVLHSHARNDSDDEKKFFKSDPSLSPGYNSSVFRYIFIAALSLGFANILF